MIRIKELQKHYSQLEKHIIDLWPQEFSEACANCTSICCKTHMADEVSSSYWLSSLSKTKLANLSSQPPTIKNQCIALGKNGCILESGKPPFCSSFYCDHLLDAIDDGPSLIAAMYLSSILTNLCKVNKRLNLITMSKTEIANYADQIEVRIKTAGKHVEQYVRFTAANHDEKPPIALEMVCEIPNILTASLSRAVLAKL